MLKTTTHHFVLVLDFIGNKTENLEDALFDAGCDDALINVRNGTVYLDFDREASHFKVAIISAIKQVESAIPAAKVVSVEPSIIVNISEIAKRCALSRQAISLLVNEQRGDGTFPAPIAQLDKRSALWRWSLVARWLCEHHKLSEDLAQEADILDVINGALSLRDRTSLLAKQSVLKEIEK